MSARAVFQRLGVESHAAPARPLSVVGEDLRPSARALPVETDAEGSDLRAMRRRLETLAHAEGVPGRLVRALGPADLEGCIGLREVELRAYLAAIARAALMDAGYVPNGWNRAGYCATCGPVYLPADHPARCSACPWCRVTRAGGDFIRPPVRCGDCAHFRPSPYNPAGGVGACGLGKVRRFSPLPWPHAQRQCRLWLHQTPGEARAALGGGDGGRECGSALPGPLGSFPACPAAGSSGPARCAVSDGESDFTPGATE